MATTSTKTTTKKHATQPKKDASPAFPGASLMNALFTKMASQGDTPPKIAKDLNITYAYLMALGRGERPVPNVDRSILEAAAKYLDIPVAQAFMLAEALSPADFTFQPTLDEKFKYIHKAMLADPIWCGYALTAREWKELDQKSKMLISLLYERAARTQFFSDPE